MQPSCKRRPGSLVELLVIEAAIRERLLKPLDHGVPVPVTGAHRHYRRVSSWLHRRSLQVKMYLNAA
jgi:hypothetical protein